MSESHSGISAAAGSHQTPPDLDNEFSPPTREEWLSTALAGLPKHNSLDTLAKETLDGLSIKVLYDGTESSHPAHKVQSDIAAGNWDNRLRLAKNSSAESLNKAIIQGLSQGHTSIEIPANQDTDFASVLKGVRLDLIGVHLRCEGDYVATAERFSQHIKTSGIDSAKIRCQFNVDPIGNWLSDQNIEQPSEETFSKAALFAGEIRKSFPAAKPLLVDISAHHNAGASAHQELMAAIATATQYLSALVDSGMELSDARDCITFQVALDADVVMGIVKLRSLDLLWNHLVSEFALANEATLNTANTNTPIVAETSRRYLSTMDHWNNHLRNIAACTAAALGSATSIIVHPHDQVGNWQADEETTLGARIARNLPIILDRECGLTQVADPLAGSYAAETLTAELVDMTWESLSESKAHTNWMETLISGDWQKALTATHKKRLDQLHAENSVMVGVNRYQQDTASADPSKSVGSQSPTSKPMLIPVRDSSPFESATKENGDTAGVEQ